MRFEKWHALGNAYLLIERADGPGLTAEQAQRLCDVRRGIGGDGVLEVLARDERRATIRIWNPDGSTAEISGNGTRIAAAWLLRETGSTSVEIDTGDRVVRAAPAGEDGLVRQELGPAVVSADEEVDVAGERLTIVPVDIGNPHAVVLVDDDATLSGLDLTHPPEHDVSLFPGGVNVEAVARRGERHVAMRVHERGSGETRSCGTGAGAVLVAAASADRAPRPATYRVDVPGGTLSLTWTVDDHVLLTGPAVIVARGTTAL